MASDPIAAEDLALLDRLAARVVELHMEVPAILALESGKPLSFLAGQAMAFFEPMVQSLFRFTEYRRKAALVERRDALETLTTLIEDKAEAARLARRAAAASRRTPRSPGQP
jgi:hypothetical protein